MKTKTAFQTPKDGHYFFGYYDKSAIDRTATRLLVQKTSFIDRMPQSEDQLEIGYFNFVDNPANFISIAKTKAWNWQQGCMLQWLGPDHKSKIIYNDRVDGKYVSIIYDLKSKVSTTYDMAVYSVSPCGSKALCIDNERHYWFRKGYSYEGIENHKKNTKLDSNDGIWKLTLTNGCVEKIIDLYKLVTQNPVDNMKDATHYFEHIIYSPNGKQFQFLHRWLPRDGGLFTRLYVANDDGTKIRLLNDSGRMTHCCWRDNETIMGWGAMESPITKLRKYSWAAKHIIKPLIPLYRKFSRGNSVQGNSKLSSLVTGDCYLSINIDSGVSKKILANELTRDGHPTFLTNNRNQFVTDTYANPDGILTLLFGDIKANSITIVDQLASIAKYDATPMRCDLHPNLSYNGQAIAVDTMNDGCRSIYIYDITKLVNN